MQQTPVSRVWLPTGMGFQQPIFNVQSPHHRGSSSRGPSVRRKSMSQACAMSVPSMHTPAPAPRYPQGTQQSLQPLTSA